jgi:hypothetical protein
LISAQRVLAEGEEFEGFPVVPESSSYVLRPVFKSTTLADRVQEALERAKNHDISYVLDLVAHFPPDQVLTEMQRSAVKLYSAGKIGIVAAAGAARTKMGLQMLLPFIGEEDDGVGLPRRALDELAYYKPSQVKSWSGPLLATSLKRFLTAEPSSVEAILLLSCCPQDASVVPFLLQHRRKHRSKEADTSVLEMRRGVTVSAICDIALAQLGNRRSLKTVLSLLDKPDPSFPAAMLFCIEFVNNRSVLRHLVQLLKDHRVARQADFGGRKVDLRLADLAHSAFEIKTGGKPLFGQLPRFRVTDKGLTEAYRRFSRLFF